MARRQGATIRDIAEHVGVSLMTVSAVLNGKDAERRISVATRDRVREASRQLDYQPNAVARSLRRKSTNVIGVYSGIGYLNASNPFLAELIGGLQEGCDLHKKDLLLHGTFRGLSVDDIYTELLSGQLDGLIVQAQPSDPLVQRLAESHLPVFAVVDAIPAVPSVVVDDAAGMRQVIAHLAGRGHRQIVFISPRVMIISAARRRAAVYAAAAEHGLQVREFSGTVDRDYSQIPLRDWLQEPAEQRPTALVAWSDVDAYTLIRHCRDWGVQVPEDIAVTGYDGVTLFSVAASRLTTVYAPWSEVGRTAIALLVAHLEGRDVPKETIVPVEFLVGDTT